MINYAIEELIIKQFVVKNKQERILWELQSSKKREMIFWKFAGPNIFKKECLEYVNYKTPNELEQYLKIRDGNTKVYYIGEGEIGEISWNEAINRIYAGNICIVYRDNGVGYYQGEEEGGDRVRCFLKKV